MKKLFVQEIDNFYETDLLRQRQIAEMHIRTQTLKEERRRSMEHMRQMMGGIFGGGSLRAA